MKELIKIQNELKAPKNQKNAHQGYMYRSCEDILETAKPLCKKYECLLTLSDELVFKGERYYIKATATITNGEQSISVSALAREQPKKMNSAGTKEIMDHSQLTGSASSYARKYALNGLFCIDDSEDVESMDSGGGHPEAEATKEQIKKLNDYLPLLKNNFPDKHSYLVNFLKKEVSKDDADIMLGRSAEITGVKK
ncbi:MAG: ERF family protein [Alphaproteobacteria bacterium]|nr:ERF family protein [Alphaproteobacteria bacterium]